MGDREIRWVNRVAIVVAHASVDSVFTVSEKLKY
jgi:hypothetical protein